MLKKYSTGMLACMIHRIMNIVGSEMVIFRQKTIKTKDKVFNSKNCINIILHHIFNENRYNFSVPLIVRNCLSLSLINVFMLISRTFQLLVYRRRHSVYLLECLDKAGSGVIA